MVSNDVHSTILSCPSFLNRLAELRAQGFLIADSGDFFEGTAEYDRFLGVPEILALQGLYDVIAPGNHGFDLYLRLASDEAVHLPIVNSNLAGWPGPRYWIDPSGKYLFTGIIGRQAFSSIEPRNDRLSFIEPLDTLQVIARRAIASGLRLIVLSHQGFQRDVLLSQQLHDRGYPAVIFSGHCHSETNYWPHPNPVVKGPELGRGFASLDDRGRIVVESLPLGGDEIAPHPLVSSYVKAYRTVIDSEPSLEIEIDPDVAEDRERFTGWVVDKLAALNPTGGAFLNRGSVRESLPSSTHITASQLIRVVPFPNELEIVRLSVEVEKAMQVLGELYGESLIQVGGGDTYVTTTFLGGRLSANSILRSTRPVNQFDLRSLIRQELSSTRAAT